MLVVASITIVKNYYNDERNVYIAFFSLFDSSYEMKDVAFVSSVSSCGVEPDHLVGASSSLFKEFYSANSDQAKPDDISSFSSMVNVVNFKDTLRLHEVGIENISSDKNIVQISRIGFNVEKDLALICMESSFSASIYMFEKVNAREWELSEHRNLWAI